MANDGTQHMREDLNTLHVWLWDLGPSKPTMPKRPETPNGKEGTGAYDLAMIEFAEVKEKYEADIKTYRKDRDEYEKWQRDQGGPIEIMMWSCNAEEALQRDPKRYTVSARTRGYQSLPNRGLPAGLKPGHGHAQQLERERQGLADLDALRKSDPVFGQQEVRS